MNGDYDLVAGPGQDLVVATGAAVGLDRLIGLYVPNFFIVVCRNTRRHRG